MSEKFRAVTVEDALKEEAPLAIAFEQVYKVLAAHTPNDSFAVLANLVAYGLKNKTPEERAQTLGAFSLMVIECVAANDSQEKVTMQ